MRKLIYKIFLAANILFALSLIVSYLAVHIDPGTFALPALFGLAYPYLLLVNIVFVIGWAAALRFEALISVAVIALGITHFSNYLKIRRPSGDKTGTFRVQSYNVRLFNNFESRKNSNSEKRILDLLRNQHSEIICLQEVYINGDPLQKESSIKSTLGGGYNSHMKFIRSGKNRYYGIATLTRYPIIGKGDIVHPRSSSLSIYTDVLVGSDTFRIFNNHLQSFHLRRMERSFINELTEASGEKETFGEIKTISANLLNGFAQRARQAHAVKDRIDKSPYPVIVAGDFNDTPVSYSYRKIRKGLNDSFVAAGYGAGFTYKGNYPPNRIDYILFDNALQCREFDIIKVRYSDHYPIISYFRKAN
ncbi:MAG: endonuclease/exonuclease/phosphatase family protein [Bacteroidales bacterium]